MDAPINDPIPISKFLQQLAEPPALALLILTNKLKAEVRQLLFSQPARQAPLPVVIRIGSGFSDFPSSWGNIISRGPQ